MTLTSRLLAVSAASLFLTSAAFAQTPSAAPAAPAAPAAKKAAAPRTAISLECSKQADAKGLHGKERHKFRSECKKGAAKT